MRWLSTFYLCSQRQLGEDLCIIHIPGFHSTVVNCQCCSIQFLYSQITFKLNVRIMYRFFLYNNDRVILLLHISSHYDSQIFMERNSFTQNCNCINCNYEATANNQVTINPIKIEKYLLWDPNSHSSSPSRTYALAVLRIGKLHA